MLIVKVILDFYNGCQSPHSGDGECGVGTMLKKYGTYFELGFNLRFRLKQYLLQFKGAE